MEQETRPFVSRFAVEAAFALFTCAFGALIIKGALEFNVGWGDIGPEAGYFPVPRRHPDRPGLARQSRPGLPPAQNVGAEVFLTRKQTRNVAAFAVPVVALVGVTMVLGLYVGHGALPPVHGRVRRPASNVGDDRSRGRRPGDLFVLFEYVFLTPLLKGPLEHLLGWY